MKEKLDIKDKRILFELEQNSRQSLTKLSKKVGLKKETVFHRMKALEKRGIIKSYLTEVDIYKIGYQFYPILLKLQNTTPRIEKEILNYLRNNPYVAWLTKCEGAWDINLTLITSGNLELNSFMKEFMEKYSNYLYAKQVFITTEIHYFKKGFWLNRKSGQTITTQGESKIKLGDEELRLLRILSTGARKSLVDIGLKLKTNPKNIAYKIKNLEKKGVIQGSRILVDFSKIGYKFYKVWFSLKNFDTVNFKRIMSYFKDNPNIVWVTKFIGYYDLSIEMEVKDVEEFRRILDDIKLKFSDLIKNHESLLIFEESVMNYLP